MPPHLFRIGLASIVALAGIYVIPLGFLNCIIHMWTLRNCFFQIRESTASHPDLLLNKNSYIMD